MARVDRGFVRIEEGQVHFRTAQPAAETGQTPLMLLHASPGSSMMFSGMLARLGDARPCWAMDTLGFGDSPPPAQASPEAADYADSVRRVLDALGLDRVDLYGSHTGAHIGCELAIMAPDRVRRVIFDGIAMFTEEERRENLQHYAPKIEPDMFGSQFNWAWHFVRDQMIHFPWFKRDRAHRRPQPFPDARMLHGIVVETLKAIETYHLGYHAAFRHPDRERLPLIAQPALAMADTNDPLWVGVEAAHQCLKNGRQAVIRVSPEEHAEAQKCAVIEAFLDAEDPATVAFAL